MVETIVTAFTMTGDRCRSDARHERREIVARLGSGAIADLAVTAVPDERKGEQLCVVHTPLAVPVEVIVAELAASGLPRLFLPRASHFVEVEVLPRTGTGKMDLAALKRVARGALAPT